MFGAAVRSSRRAGLSGAARYGSGYSRVLVVVKHTPYESYSQLRLRGKAPKALRWERLRDRHDSHQACVRELCELIRREVPDPGSVSVVSRDDLGRQHLDGVDLLVAVGGDGTVLSATHFVDSQTKGGEWGTGPAVLGVNSDPTRACERVEASGPGRVIPDERRSFGALCFAAANTLQDIVPKVLRGELDHAIQRRHRIAVTVRGTLSETRLPPALNDILVSHPSPAAVSRFRLDAVRNDAPGVPSATGAADEFSFNAWSSGLWVATATGATGVMASAGGDAAVDAKSPDLQFLVREHLIGENDDVAFVRAKSHGFIDTSHHLKLRWNSQYGAVYIDGHHTRFDLELGDQIFVSSHASPLRIFARDAAERV